MESSKEIERLKRKLIGLWDVELTRTKLGGPKVTGMGILLAKETAQGHAIFAEFGLSIPDTDPYEEGEFWWVDNQDNKVHLFCVNSREEGREQTGRWKDENTLVLEWNGIQEGKQISATFTFTWVSSDEIHVLRVDRVQGEKGPVSIFTLKRQKEMTLA
ncbi:MAG: hypothetical protein LUO93_00565 [Methanomicrobiales archaeon]|nr:hypothetical protein [Methanomicrobiales archaeon]